MYSGVPPEVFLYAIYVEVNKYQLIYYTVLGMCKEMTFTLFLPFPQRKSDLNQCHHISPELFEPDRSSG